MNNRSKRNITIIAVILLAVIAALLFWKNRMNENKAIQEDDIIALQNVNLIKEPNSYSCTFSEQEHKFDIYFPENFDASTTHPLVVMLHGFGNSAESFATQTKFEKEACKEGYVVVYLTSTPDSKGDIGWNSGLGESDKDDVGYIKALVSYLQKEYNCDKNRTFAVGFSNGAFMTQRLAVDADDTFTGVASVAGMMPKLTWDSRKEQANVGVLEIYGTKDDVVPMISNGSNKTAVAPAIEDVMEYWRQANNLSEKKEEDLSKITSCVKCYNEEKTQFVWTVVIEDGRHSWPDEGYCGFSVNKLILEFFDQY